MEEQYWLKQCPFCNQGRLFVYKNLNKNVLYLHCEECERGYYDFVNVEKINSFLTLTDDFDATIATAEDIKNFGLDINKFIKIIG